MRTESPLRPCSRGAAVAGPYRIAVDTLDTIYRILAIRIPSALDMVLTVRNPTQRFLSLGRTVLRYVKKRRTMCLASRRTAAVQSNQRLGKLTVPELRGKEGISGPQVRNAECMRLFARSEITTKLGEHRMRDIGHSSSVDHVLNALKCDTTNPPENGPTVVVR